MSRYVRFCTGSLSKLSIPAQSENPEGENYEDKETKDRIKKVLNAQGYTPEMAGEKGLAVLLPFMMVRFRSQFERILKKTGSPDKTKTAKAHEELEALKKDLTKMAEDCIMIINR